MPRVACLLVVCLLTFLPACQRQAYDGRFGVVARTYADTMIEHGRDVFGDGDMPTGDRRKSGLFLSALDRRDDGTAAPLEHVPPAPPGVRRQDRVFDIRLPEKQRELIGCNPGHDQELYLLLYELDGPYPDAGYADHADAALRWLFNNARSGVGGRVEVPTDLLAWGEHASWDPKRDLAIGATSVGPKHEFYTAWHLWKRSAELSPEGVKAFARGLWNHQILDQKTGLFNRDHPYDGAFPDLDRPLDFARHAGFYLYTWAHATAASGDNKEADVFLEAITTLLNRYRNQRAVAEQLSGKVPGLLPFTADTRDRLGVSENLTTGLSSSMELSIQAHDAAEVLRSIGQTDLADRLQGFSEVEDSAFWLFNHDLSPEGKGLVSAADIRDLRVLAYVDTVWGAAYGPKTLVQQTPLLIARYRQLTRAEPPSPYIDLYRKLILQIADAYLTSLPDGLDDAAADEEADVEPIWPEELAAAIELLSFAYQQTEDVRYRARAEQFGDLGVRVFFAGHPLPRADPRSSHYEAITGGDDLALALFRLDRLLAKQGD